MADAGEIEQIEELTAAVVALRTRVGLSGQVERSVRRQKFWLVVIGLLVVAVIAVGVRQVVVEAEVCRATKRSWDARARSHEIITAPVVLSPKIEDLFPSSEVESLRIQVDAANKTRAAQRAELVAANGPRPNC